MNTFVKDISILDLDHPGAKDPGYRARRAEIVGLAQGFRQNGGSVPRVNYTQEEHAVWQTVTQKLAPLHQEVAFGPYLDAKDRLGISTARIPEFADINRTLKPFHAFQVEPVEGLVEPGDFFSTFNRRVMLCTQYIRHASRPEYTPEPDIVHEVIGHVPMFTDRDFVEFSELIGQAALKADEAQMRAIERLYWFTIEFGLIEERGRLKVYGAGLLSSFGELRYCLSSDVDRRPFKLEEVIAQDYNHSRMQDLLYVVPSFRELKETAAPFLEDIAGRA